MQYSERHITRTDIIILEARVVGGIQERLDGEADEQEIAAVLEGDNIRGATSTTSPICRPLSSTERLQHYFSTCHHDDSRQETNIKVDFDLRSRGEALRVIAAAEQATTAGTIPATCTSSPRVGQAGRRAPQGAPTRRAPLRRHRYIVAYSSSRQVRRPLSTCLRLYEAPVRTVAGAHQLG